MWIYKNFGLPIKYSAMRLLETPLQLDILKHFTLTFPIYLFINKTSKKKKKKCVGYPPFQPLKSGASQKEPRWPPTAPILYCRILFYYKNGGVCKTLDINILKIDRASLLKNSWIFSKILRKFSSVRKTIFKSNVRFSVLVLKISYSSKLVKNKVFHAY